MQHLSREIAKVRREQEKSLRDVADATKLSHQAIAFVESGEGRLETAMKVAKALGISARKVIKLAQLDVAQMARSA